MPSRSSSRAMVMLAGLELAGLVPKGYAVDVMSERIGIAPDMEMKVRLEAKKRSRRNTYTGPHCPACHGVIATDSPCMRRSCKAFNKPVKGRW